MIDLNNKTAIITGSTSGIGLSIANELASKGANIVLNGFGDEQEIEKIQANFKEQYNTRTLYCPADVSKADDLKNMVEQTIVHFKAIDIIVNNAGIQFVAPIEEFPESKWDDIIAINLSSAFKLIKYAAPYMKQQEWGRIINIASAHGMVASAFKSAYVAAKHGLVGLTKVAALEYAETNVTCNVICPGYVKTPLVEKQIAEQAKAHNIPESQVINDIILKAQPNKKFIQPEDLAKFVLFLCSPYAKSMTGEVLAMDGAWTAQ